ncbi:MAG TPA: hypothetical protein VMZ71_02325 [Gemmataceae bacterium]|nr:hypothetical protein [Gemmataceae bacterium]
MTVTFKIDSLQVEGSVSLVPEVITDATQFTTVPPPFPNVCPEQGGMPSCGSQPEVEAAMMRSKLRSEVTAIGDGKILSGLLQLIAFLRSIGVIKTA